MIRFSTHVTEETQTQPNSNRLRQGQRFLLSAVTSAVLVATMIAPAFAHKGHGPASSTETPVDSPNRLFTVAEVNNHEHCPDCDEATRTDFYSRLVTLGNANANDPVGFLNGFSGLHTDWHDIQRDNPDAQTYGFLLFHQRVCRYFNAIVNSRRQTPIQPYTATELRQLGISPISIPALADITTLSDIYAFSHWLENEWHNPAHMTLAEATGTPMGDPSVNIYYVPFWRFHLYIAQLMDVVLKQYGDYTHPGAFSNTWDVQLHIENDHWDWMPYL